MKRLGPNATLTMCCAAYIALGATKATLGPSLPELAARSGASVASFGSLYSVIFAACLITQALTGAVVDRIGPRRVVLAGLSCLAIWPLTSLAATDLRLLLMAAAALGCALGTVGMGANLLVAGIFVGPASVAALNLLNLFFGLGSVLGPLLSGVSHRLWGSALPSNWLYAVLALATFPFACLAADVQGAHAQRVSRELVRATLRQPLLWLIAASMLLYTGVEVGLSAWTTEYLLRTTGIAFERAAYAVAGFWLALTTGRLIVAFWLKRVAPQTLLAVSCIGASLGAILLSLGVGQLTLTVVALAIIGLCLGPIYPTMFAVITAAFPAAPGLASSTIVAVSGVGGMLLPMLQGKLLAQSGSASAIMLTVSLLALSLLNAARERHSAALAAVEST